MPYGTIKVDTITFTDAGVDKSVAISGLVQNPTFTGNVTATGTISGLIVQAPTVTGTTANFASGVYTTQISGALVKVPAGSAGAPSIQVGVGTSVAPGLYGAGTDILGISTGGAGRIFIDSTGRLGVGTNSLTTQGAQKLTVFDGSISTTNNTSSAANGELRFIGRPDGVNYNWAGIRAISDANVNQGVLAFFTSGSNTSGESSTERLRIDSSGNVGIGTSSPGTTLEISNGSGSSPNLSGTSGNLAITQPGLLTSLQIGGYGSTPFALWLQGQNKSGNTFPIALNPAGGNVGIGTSSPSDRLHVANGYLRVTGPAGDGSNIYLYANNATTNPVRIGQGYSNATDNVGFIVNSAASDLVLGTNNAENFRITSSGNVGIGASSAAYKLVVDGGSGANVGIRGGSFGLRIDNDVTFGLTGTTIHGVDNSFTTSYQPLVLNGSQLGFAIGGTERARIDTSGRLLVGTTSTTTISRAVFQGNSTNQSANADVYLQTGEAAATLGIDVNLGVLSFGAPGGRGAAILGVSDIGWSAGSFPTRLVFSTTINGSSNLTERMRIGNDGKTDVRSLNADTFICRSALAASTTDWLIRGLYSTVGFNSGTTSFRVATNGNVNNTNGVYSSISDIKLKENIVDANSQWDDIKALQVRNYNLKEGQTHTQIGLIAQEVELISPGLVTESFDRDDEGNDLGTVTKSVSYSVLYMKAVKALQEAMERIETLETKVAALENA